jgi:hypothetical protein
MVWRKNGKNDEILTSGEDGNYTFGRKFRNKRTENIKRASGKQKQLLQLV